jgi:hypothetical protein
LQKAQQTWQQVQPVLVKTWETIRWLAQQAKRFWDFAFPKIDSAWNRTRPLIRRVLPAKWNERITDRMMTSGAIALLVGLTWLTTTLLSPKPAVSKQPPPTAISQPQVEPVPSARIANIQKQFVELTESYAPDLVEAVQVNPQRDLLQLQVSGEWYGLAANQQDRLAGEMWKRSQKLRFSQLDVTDAEGNLLARSPVIGKQMIVLQRS